MTHFAGSVRPLIFASAMALAASAALAEPVVYSGTAVMSGQLGTYAFQNARVTIEFHGDTANAVPFVWSNGALVKGQGCDAPPHAATHPACGFVNDVGIATVRIGDGGGHAVDAVFDPTAAIFVSFDVQNGGVGFGHTYQGNPIPPYPLAFKNGNVKAVGDLQYNQTTGYSAGITQLVTDLTQPTSLSGDALACDNPVGLGCTNPTANPGALVLPTDRGPFYLTNPYLDPKGNIVNEGLFSIELPHRHPHPRSDGIVIGFGPP